MNYLLVLVLLLQVTEGDGDQVPALVPSLIQVIGVAPLKVTHQCMFSIRTEVCGTTMQNNGSSTTDENFIPKLHPCP